MPALAAVFVTFAGVGHVNVKADFLGMAIFGQTATFSDNRQSRSLSLTCGCEGGLYSSRQ